MMATLSELQKVVLTKDLSDYGLKVGDMGTVVAVWGDGDSYDVEFVRGDGSTIAVLTLHKAQVRAMTGTEIPSVRETRLSWNAP